MPLRESGEFFALPPIFPNSRIIFISTHLAARSTPPDMYRLPLEKYLLRNEVPVIFTGCLKGEDLSQAYAFSDLFIFPSETDTFGNAVLEAQASGLPVFVTATGGPKENMIHNETGIIMNTGEIEEIVSDIQKIKKDDNFMKIMRRKARSYIENRTFESAYLENWEYYKTAIQ